VTTYYVGLGGSDAANGLSWANRKLTLNGAEDVPVASGDTVYVAPGVYRELLTVDISGASAITYIADVTGQNTDGIGGVVRITGSDNDQTTTRASCITATSKNYRTFRGFTFDTCSAIMVTLLTACSNWVIEDCYFGMSGVNSGLLTFAGTGTNNTVRRCVFWGSRANGITFTHTVTVSTSGHLVENCFITGILNVALGITRVGGITVKNCAIVSCATGISVLTALAVGQTTTVNNCILANISATALNAATAPGTNLEITENYNALFGAATARTNVTAGGNSNTFPPLLEQPTFLDGFRYPWNPFALSQWSALRRITGTSMATEDSFGITRPATASKVSWGPFQYNDLARETTTVRTGSASIKLADAGVFQMFVPTTNVSTTFSVYVQWEADYAGTKPTMTVKQPGQSDTVVTATGGSGSWELLTTTLTPAALPGYVVVEFASSNTAASTNFDTFFDDFTVA
jgi:hypothetical protein